MVSKGPVNEHRPLTKKERDEHYAARVPSVLQYHENMLADGVRNRLLSKAIKRALKPGMSFLDIGAGSGVWAILAAKLGAGRVVAVEMEESLIPVIYRLAVENGVADKVEIIHGRSDDIKLKGKFDVIVSELFNGDAFGKDTVGSFVDLRTRFLAVGGQLIPEKLELMAVPAYFKRPADQLPSGLDISAAFFRDVKLNHALSIPFGTAEKIKLLADPRPIVMLDLLSLDTSFVTADLSAEWQLKDMSGPNGILTYPRSTFAKDIVMDSLSSQSWAASFYPMMPFPKGKGRLRFCLTMDQQNSTWSFAAPDISGSKQQVFSPVFAFTRLKMAHAMTPHKRTVKRRSQGSDR